MKRRAEIPAPYMTMAQFTFDGRHGDGAVCGVRIFSALNVGAEQVTAVVTNLGRNEDTSITPVADMLADRIAREFDIEPRRFNYIEYFPAQSETIIQERLLAPATPARFVRVRFDFDQASGFTNPRRELIEITEVAYLTNTPVESWHRELEETAGCNRLYAMLGELGPSRTFELLQEALQRHHDQAERAAETGAVPDYSPKVWERIRDAVVQLVLCSETVVLPEGDT